MADLYTCKLGFNISRVRPEMTLGAGATRVAEGFAVQVATAYEAETGLTPSLYISRAAAGASAVHPLNPAEAVR